jgi:hypothetical protein
MTLVFFACSCLSASGQRRPSAHLLLLLFLLFALLATSYPLPSTHTHFLDRPFSGRPNCCCSSALLAPHPKPPIPSPPPSRKLRDGLHEERDPKDDVAEGRQRAGRGCCRLRGGRRGARRRRRQPRGERGGDHLSRKKWRVRCKKLARRRVPARLGGWLVGWLAGWLVGWWVWVFTCTRPRRKSAVVAGPKKSSWRSTHSMTETRRGSSSLASAHCGCGAVGR